MGADNTMVYILETSRLRLRQFTHDDTAFVIALMNSPGWLRFIGDRNVRTEIAAKHYLDTGPLKSFRERGFGLALVERKEDGIAVGMCGLLWRKELGNPDIGFAFLAEFGGLGYAFEITTATMRYAREMLGIPEVFAIVQPDNERSIRLLEKLGMHYRKKFRFSDSGEELLLYSAISAPAEVP